MAKKKIFDNIVNESFEEGYTSEPEVVTAPVPETPVTATEQEQATPAADVIEEQPTEILPEPEAVEPQQAEPEPLSDNELLLQKVLAEDPEVLSSIINHPIRATYYLTDFHLACIDIMAYEDGINKSELVKDALNQYFSEETKAAARARVVSLATKKLKQKIKEEKA